jgi:hypothetical protein
MMDETPLQHTEKDMRIVEVTVSYLDALRKAVGRQIDPETAEVERIYAQTTRDVLWNKHKSHLGFLAGLFTASPASN